MYQAPCRLDAELLGGAEQQVGLGLGVLDVARVDDRRFRVEAERLDRHRDLVLAARRCDRPVDPAFLERLDELADAGQRARGAVEPLVDLARAFIDRLGAPVVDRSAGARGDLAGQAFAIDPDQRRQIVPGGGQVDLLEDGEPRVDPGLDRVHEGAVEVEEDGVGEWQLTDVGGHRAGEKRITRRMLLDR